jgi:hypothetical protein
VSSCTALLQHEPLVMSKHNVPAQKVMVAMSVFKHPNNPDQPTTSNHHTSPWLHTALCCCATNHSLLAACALV